MVGCFDEGNEKCAASLLGFKRQHQETAGISSVKVPCNLGCKTC